MPGKLLFSGSWPRWELDSVGRVSALWSRHLASEGVGALVRDRAHRSTAARVLHEQQDLLWEPRIVWCAMGGARVRALDAKWYANPAALACEVSELRRIP